MFLQARETAPCNRHHAISLLFANDPGLFPLFFDADRLTLRGGDHRATRRMADDELDMQQGVLVHLALDLWLERGHTSLHHVYRCLNADRFQGFLMAVELLYAAGGCDCQSCRQRFSPLPSDWLAFPQTF